MEPDNRSSSTTIERIREIQEHQEYLTQQYVEEEGLEIFDAKLMATNVILDDLINRI